MAIEVLEDVKGSDHMELEWGYRFRGWYRTKTFKKTVSLSLGPNDLTYQFKICDYQFKFILPARVEFFKGIGEEGKLEYGIISYGEGERLLGVFRYPMGMDGYFAAPLTTQQIEKQWMDLTPEQVKELVQKKKVLTFEAFRIPFFGFEYFSLSESDFSEIKGIANEDVSSSIRRTYERETESKIDNVKEKILSLPNYLLILQNVLDLHWRNETEISTMTGGILHFGI
jgi:hypothetical protein